MRAPLEPGGSRNACAMFAGTGTVSWETSFSHVSSPSAIMSSIEPITRSRGSLPLAAVLKVPRPAWR